MKYKNKNNKLNRLTRTRLIGLAALAALILAALSTASACGGDAKSRRLYDQGIAHYSTGEMNEAKRCFIESGLYGDSQSYLESIAEYEKLYKQGVEALGEGEYIKARSFFSAIEKYLNSQSYIDYIDGLKASYEKGIALYEQGEYLQAYSEFTAANGYENSADYIGSVNTMRELYNLGIEFMNSGNYSDALDTFQAINAVFEDSDELMAECTRLIPASMVTVNNYIRNYDDNYNGIVKMEQGAVEREFRLRDSQGVEFYGVADEGGRIRYIAFSFSTALRSKLGDDNMPFAVAHCLNALNPHIAQPDEIAHSLNDYYSERTKYGCMRVYITVGNYGEWIVNAAFTPNDA